MVKMLSASLVLILLASSLGGKSKGDSAQVDSAPKPRPIRLYEVMINDKYGFIDEAGDLKFTLPDDVYTVRGFSEGLLVVARRVPDTNGRWGFVDHTGKFVIEARFNLAKPFSEGLAAVIVREEEKSGGKVGYIDHSGRFVIQPRFEPSSTFSDFSFSEGLAPVVMHGKWGYIDKSGKFVIEPQFAHAFSFSEGRAMVGIPERLYSIRYNWGFIDKQGRWIVPPRYDSVSEFSEGMAAILFRDKVGFVDLQGEIVIKPQFDPDGGCPDGPGRVGFSRFSEGLAPVQVNRKWGFIDRTGKWVIKPSYACAQPFSQGRAGIGVRDEQGRWRFGYIDKTGAAVVEPQLGLAYPFVGNLAQVGVGMSDEDAFLKALTDHEAGKPEEEIEKELESHKTRTGYIDRSGKVIWKPVN